MSYFPSVARGSGELSDWLCWVSPFVLGQSQSSESWRMIDWSDLVIFYHCGQGTGPVPERGDEKAWSTESINYLVCLALPATGSPINKSHRDIAVIKPRGWEIITGAPESLLMGDRACAPAPPPELPPCIPWRCSRWGGETRNEAPGGWETGRETGVRTQAS